MNLIRNTIKGVIFITGAAAWGIAILDMVREPKEEDRKPIVMPVMLIGKE